MKFPTELLDDTTELLRRTKEEWKEIGRQLCKIDEKVVWGKEVIGSSGRIHWTKDDLKCERGELVGIIHTHTSRGIGCHSINDVHFFGKRLMETPEFISCVIIPERIILTEYSPVGWRPILQCFESEATHKDVERVWKEEIEQEIELKKRRGEFGFTREVRLVNSLFNEGKIKEEKLIAPPHLSFDVHHTNYY